MDTTSYIALSRQIGLQRRMSTIANNIANANSTGYRAEKTLFETVLERAGESRQVAFVTRLPDQECASSCAISATRLRSPAITVGVMNESRGFSMPPNGNDGGRIRRS